MSRPVFAAALCLLLVAAGGCKTENSQTSAKQGKGVRIIPLDDRLRVEINGILFTEYIFKNTPRPYCYPLIGPAGAAMTRNWPMKDVPGEEHDHVHHRSFWFAHGSVNGCDFWSEQPGTGTIRHDRFDEIQSGANAATIKARNTWLKPDGTIVCTDERTLRIYTPKSDREQTLDFEITLHASNKEITFGDTKEGTMALRLAETMRLKGPTGHGHIVNSAGVRDADTWGKRADWCDYYGPVDGKLAGIAMFDHPKNPRHPTWWHVRDYGLFAANPFGRHDFEGLFDKSAGNLMVPAGGSITFRYRFLLHAGDAEEAQLAKHYQAYVKSEQ